MKNFVAFCIMLMAVSACNNSGDGNDSNDSLYSPYNPDPNNRNTIGYDSAARAGDTASYDQLPPRHQLEDSVKS